MKDKRAISEKWIKASIIGTIWAASEIVLGSFLHNLKIPFSGNILTGIGLIILISVSYIWRDRGLYWRAGIICALMKSLSPSAFIFGPMIAIAAESFLLELSVRLFGRTAFAFIAGSMLAMSWNLFQKAVNLIIFYGNNLIDLYTNMVRYAEKQLNIHFDIFWLPLVVLLALYCLFGFFVAVIGIRTGRKVVNQPSQGKVNNPSVRETTAGNSKTEFSYSVFWLVTDILLMVVMMILVSKAKWFYYIPAISAVVVLWSLRYKRAMRQISKPRFWIIFALLTMVSAFFFTGVQSGEKDFMGGILIGIEMNFRAIVIIIGFTVLGTELYNPRIRDLFMKTSFRQLPLALELSAESLPSMIASVPDVKTLLKNPVSILSAMISGVELRLDEIRNKGIHTGEIFILTGDVGEGKTSCIISLTDELKSKGIAVSGLYSLRLMSGGETTGYDVVDISNDKRTPFLRTSGVKGSGLIGRFIINEGGLKTGVDALSTEKTDRSRLVIIDETGPLELKDEGWSKSIGELVKRKETNLLLVVRRSIVTEVMNKWGIEDAIVFDVKKDNHREITERIIQSITPHGDQQV